jgi:hypothetical protein
MHASFSRSFEMLDALAVTFMIAAGTGIVLLMFVGR